MSFLTILVDLGFVILSWSEELKFYIKNAGLLIGDAAEVPVIAISILSNRGDVLTNFSIEDFGFVPISGNIFDKLKSRIPFVVFRKIGSHLKWTVDDNIQSQ